MLKPKAAPTPGVARAIGVHEQNAPNRSTPNSLMISLGAYASLFPVALLNSIGTSLLGALLLLLAYIIKPRLNIFDLLLLVLCLMGAYAWLSAEGFGQSFIESQISSYMVFLCSLRFFHAGRQGIERLLLSLPIAFYVVLCLFYLGVQTHVGYVYEVGVLEAYMMVCVGASAQRRNTMLVLLTTYLLLMYLISTRDTPLAAALIVMVVWMLKMPRQLYKYMYLTPIFVTPFVGFILMRMDLSDSVLVEDGNIEIRLEMLKGASAQLGLDEILLGMGFGSPFRDTSYAYAFWHPLLNERFAVFKVSNHNSLFDVFLRFGIFGYVLFCVLFLKIFSLDRLSSRYGYVLLFIVLYSLSVNAYLDSTRLAHSCAAMIGGIYILLKPRYFGAGYNISRKQFLAAEPRDEPIGTHMLNRSDRNH